MKTYVSLALILALGILPGPRALSNEPNMLQPDMLDFRAAAVPQVLEVYKSLTQTKLITDSRASKVSARITLKPEHSVSAQQAARLIEEALLEQAAIVITPLGERRVSVTYNDALTTGSNATGESATTAALPPAGGSAWTTQYYQVDTNSFLAGLKTRMKSDAAQLDIKLLRDYFKQQGIDVTQPFSTMYKPGTGDILVRMRQEDREKITRLIKELQSGK